MVIQWVIKNLTVKTGHHDVVSFALNQELEIINTNITPHIVLSVRDVSTNVVSLFLVYLKNHLQNRVNTIVAPLHSATEQASQPFLTGNRGTHMLESTQLPCRSISNDRRVITTTHRFAPCIEVLLQKKMRKNSCVWKRIGHPPARCK